MDDVEAGVYISTDSNLSSTASVSTPRTPRSSRQADSLLERFEQRTESEAFPRLSAPAREQEPALRESFHSILSSLSTSCSEDSLAEEDHLQVDLEHSSSSDTS